MRATLIGLILVGTGAGAGSALAGDTMPSAGAEMVTIHDVDFRGRPPFRRSMETLPASEVARLEPQSAAGGETVTVRTIDFSGKPPFRRATETLPVAEVARLEAASETSRRPSRFRGYPPFHR